MSTPSVDLSNEFVGIKSPNPRQSGREQVADGLLTRAVDWVFGYDFFISYNHGDGMNLPLRLRERLTQAGFRVFLDQTDYAPGLDLRRETRRQVSKSRKLIVVARPRSLQSRWVEREVEVSLERGKIPIIVNVNGAVEAASGSRLAAKALEQQWLRLDATLEGPDAPLPDATIYELVRSFNHTRQETKRQRVFAIAAAVLALTASGAVWQAVEAIRSRSVAEAQRDRAQRTLDQVIANSNRRVNAIALRMQSEHSVVREGAVASLVSPDKQELEAVPSLLANTAVAQATELLAKGQSKAAQGVLQSALERLPSNAVAVSDERALTGLVQVYRLLALANRRVGDVSGALAVFARGMALIDAAPPVHRDRPGWPVLVSAFRSDLAECLMSLGQLDDAEKQLRLVVDARAGVLAAKPDSVETARELGAAHSQLGDLFLARLEPEAALRSFTLALGVIETTVAQKLVDSEVQHDLAAVYQRLADALLALRRDDEALSWINKDVALSEPLALASNLPRMRRDLASSYDRRGRTLEKLGNVEGALADYVKGVEILEAVGAIAGAEPSWQRDTAALLESEGKLLAKIGHPERAITALRRALAIREGLAASSEEISWQQELEASYRRASEIMLAMDRPVEALETAEQYLLAVTLSGDADGKRTERVARALGTLSWSATNARSFQRAVWAGRNAIELAPELDWVKLNYAHALLFSGEREAALQIYLSGLALPAKQADSWKASLLNDLATLKKHGLDDALVTDVKNRLGS